MEQVIEIDMDTTIAEALTQRKGKKKTVQGRTTKKKAEAAARAGTGESLLDSSKEKDVNDENPPGGISLSVFDYSVENHFKAMDMISKLCGEAELEFDQSEIQRLSSSITFLREWRQFNYQPKIIRFACQSEGPHGKDVIGAINLPQFSAATVPKKDQHCGNTILSESSNDFVMYVGGPVWALDWCPTVHQKSDCDTKSEFIAVAAHPPESSYHKMGAPLTGRGLIQIWCLLNFSIKEENVHSQVNKTPKQNPRNSETKVESTQNQKRRGRPRKTPVTESVDNLDFNNQHVKAAAVQFLEDSSTTKVKLTLPKKRRGRPRKTLVTESVDNLDFNNEFVEAAAVQFLEDSSTTKVKSTQQQKRRGRPRKTPATESVDDLDFNNQHVEAADVQFLEDSSTLVPNSGASGDTHEQVTKRYSGRKRKSSSQGVSVEPKQNPSNSETIEVKSPQPKKGRGRSKKQPRDEPEVQYVQALAVQFPEISSTLLPIDKVSGTIYEQVAKRKSGKKQKGSNQGVTENSELTVSEPRRLKDKARTRRNFHGNGLPLLTQDENDKSSLEASSSCGQDSVGRPSENVTNNGSLEINPAICSTPKDVALPRAVLCLAHNGKVAWDVKWRPFDSCDTKSNHRMGYLAVLLGNGALEVWEVPSPHAVRDIYSASWKEGTDPRFVKLDPVFRCSMLKCGDRQSIPLTVEWSTSPPHDLILAGCHDGVVALWKFLANGSSKDTRPLLCFSADTVPIRALAWAPFQSDPESSNVIVTAGHKGLKFWDIRDPFRPLWNLNPVQRAIYSLDWLPDPRCVIVSFDDGTIRILSLSKAAYDVPVTGKPFVGTQQQGLHSYYCSSFAIWSIQVSRPTGMVAYCSADGTVLRFQLTTRAVEKDPLRNRAPHFLCGSLTEEELTLTVTSPLPDIPYPMRKSLNEWSNTPRTIRGFLSVSNQEKRAKEQMAKGQTSNEQPLALCYGDDPAVESGSEDILVAQKSKKVRKAKTSSKKKLNADGELVCRDDDPETGDDCEKGEVGDEIEVLPPKIIAMHRVRWNMNKGSERWLCSGGASGIVRCQEINMSGSSF